MSDKQREIEELEAELYELEGADCNQGYQGTDIMREIEKLNERLEALWDDSCCKRIRIKEIKSKIKGLKNV